MDELMDMIKDIDIPNILSKTTISNEIQKKLLSYQHNHVMNMIQIITKYYVALDSSETGTGKTYTTCALCKELGKKPIIVCPKTLMIGWRNVLKYFGITSYNIVNYETIINGKMYTDKTYTKRDQSTFIHKNKHRNGNPDGYYYIWNVPSDAIVIFDEAHRSKEPNTANGKLLISTKQLIKKKIPVILLSATVCEKFEDMKIPFILFGFIPSPRNYNEYVKLVCNKYPKYKINKNDYTSSKDYAIANENNKMMTIYEEIKFYTSRIKIQDLGDMFPSNQWCAQEFYVKNYNQISDAYNNIRELCRELEEKKISNEHVLPRIQKMKQKIELLKVPIFVEQAELYMENGKSVIIFVNYIDTMKTLIEHLNIKSSIHGSQSADERQKAINDFQSNKERIIICQIRAGGVGIGLHDIHGGHPRVTLINYPNSASDLIQALGRAPRAGAKTPVLQRIIFAANVSYEKMIMKNINKKLANLSAINDGNLDAYKYDLYNCKNE